VEETNALAHTAGAPQAASRSLLRPLLTTQTAAWPIVWTRPRRRSGRRGSVPLSGEERTRMLRLSTFSYRIDHFGHFAVTALTHIKTQAFTSWHEVRWATQQQTEAFHATRTYAGDIRCRHDLGHERRRGFADAQRGLCRQRQCQLYRG